MNATSVTLPTCVDVSGTDITVNNLRAVSRRTYQQTFQVYGGPGVSDHVLQLLLPGFHPPLGAQRHDCEWRRSLKQNKQTKKRPKTKTKPG